MIGELKKENNPLMPLPYPELPFNKFTLNVLIRVLKLADIIFEQ